MADVKVRAATLVRELIKKHNLVGWRFEWDRAVARHGACHYGTKRITLSEPITTHPDRTWEETEQTIFHEVAHAIVGVETKIVRDRRGRTKIQRIAHGDKWLAKAQELGYTGSRCKALPAAMAAERVERVAVKRANSKYVGTCSKCDVEIPRHKAPPVLDVPSTYTHTADGGRITFRVR